VIEPVLVAREGVIATVALNNPDKLNALNKPMWEKLGIVMGELSADAGLRCVVLRGAGDKAFAAGADISEFARERADSRQAKDYGALIHATMQSIAHCVHPVIAMIRGACVGGGLEIAAMCDLRICGESSRFGVPIKNLGLTMGYGELQGVLGLVGRAITSEILLEGRIFDAAEALQKRLVNRVVRDADLKHETYALAERIAAGAPLVARWHKQFIERLCVAPQIPQAEWDEGYACFDTEDYRIGVAAFLAKTKPQFRGR
jgi:enoyl-CoA hydratase/carnithine racemase